MSSRLSRRLFSQRAVFAASRLTSATIYSPITEQYRVSKRYYSSEEESHYENVKGKKINDKTWQFPLNPFFTHKLEKAPEQTITTTRDELLHFYKQMQRVRLVENAADAIYKKKQIRGFLHIYSGQEAICIGMESGLTLEDHIVTAYRDHGHAISRGDTPKRVLAELCGKYTGCSKGKGGSMHMYKADANFYGGNGIVGAQVPIGAGLAFAQKYFKTGRVAVTLYGDGAANQGQVFEAYNIAALWKLPCIFVCENNKVGMGTEDFRSSASTEYYKRGDYIPGLKVDGMDVLAVKQATLFAVDHAQKKGPIVLEMETYRYLGHSMSDPGTTYRTADQVAEMRKRKDPITQLRERLVKNGIATEEEIKAINKDVKQEVDEAVQFATDSPFPPLDEVYKNVYVEPTPVRAVELSASYQP